MENEASLLERADRIRAALPDGGLFAQQEWRISPAPFPLSSDQVHELNTLGKVLHRFYRAANLLYRGSRDGRFPEWVARWLDLGKPEPVLALQNHPTFAQHLPSVIRPDLLITDQGLALTELDAVPGGIGLTAWLNQTYADNGISVLGGRGGMLQGFAGIFREGREVQILVSDEAAGYRPEMEWLARALNNRGHAYQVRNASLPLKLEPETEVYRFFELFDLDNLPGSAHWFELARENRIRVTPPPRFVFEEKLLFALLWNRRLADFWRRELGAGYLKRLRELVPYTWALDPEPLPPQAAVPRLDIADWEQLKALSQRNRNLILKISGYSPEAWGARGVYLGSDLSGTDWSAAVSQALERWPRSPFVLQEYKKPKVIDSVWADFETRRLIPMPGRVRLCPYYFVQDQGERTTVELGGALATICPADKKIIHGMSEAIMAPCAPA